MHSVNPSARPFGIASFRSRTQVLRFEDALRRAGLSVGVISTPKEVAMGCGLSVRFELTDFPQVAALYRRLNPGALIGFSFGAASFGIGTDGAEFSIGLRF